MNEIERTAEKTYSLSNSSDTVVLKDEERQPCEIWTRVMGYFRPLSFYNRGKRQEYDDRKCFKIPNALEQIEKGKLKENV